MAAVKTDIVDIDIAEGVRPLNALLHEPEAPGGPRLLDVRNPRGQHNVAVGARWPAVIEVRGHVGYYGAAMNQAATVHVHGNAGKGLAENIMSGSVHVFGDASDAVAASGHGGMVVVHGNAASRCGISMKGVDIVVGGSIGHLGAFMAQAGTLVVCGDAGAGLGDSLYEAVLYIGGRIESLGADAREEPMTEADRACVSTMLARAGLRGDIGGFRRIASARKLYHWNSGDDRIHG
jgi:methylamine---glutamate N-methyltransferase subunit B